MLILLSQQRKPYHKQLARDVLMTIQQFLPIPLSTH